MKEKIMSRLPVIYVYYTLIVFVTSAYNLLMGYTSMSTRYFVELFAFLVVFNICDALLENVNFKSFWSCAVGETAMAYILFLVFAYLFNWIAFTPKQLVHATILFLIIAILGITYMNYRQKLRSNELNELLQKKNV